MNWSGIPPFSSTYAEHLASWLILLSSLFHHTWSGKIDNSREIKMNFEEKEKNFDPEKVYKGQPNPTKI